MKSKKIFLILIFAVLFTGVVSANKTSVKNLNEYTLPNGLSLFTFENHNVPLVYIQVSVRAGAVTQTPENAGLFHLYEHMMFKGNSLYPDAAAVNKAINDMGTSTWNGNTSIDSVNYFFTVPSSQLENGLAFWNAAIRFPLLDEKELENEKKVVLSEIEGNLARDGQIYGDFLYSHFFLEEPYKNDAGGNPDIIRAATVNDLRRIKNEYYIPSNAAVFVGGDINPDSVYELVKKIFGTWDNHGAVVKKSEKAALRNPLSQKKFYVMPYDQIQKGLAQIQIVWRGPDADFDIEDTYAADYLSGYCTTPDSLFMKTLLSDESIGIIPDSSCLWGGYTTRRQNGLISFGAVLGSPENNICGRASLFEKQLVKLLTETVPQSKEPFSRKAFKRMKSVLEDERIALSETCDSLLSNLAFWWTSTNKEYFYTYIDRMKKVSKKDVKKFSEKYFTNNSAVFIMVHPDVYASCKSEFEEAGYELITRENALWWKQENFKFSRKEVEPEPVYEEEIYFPDNSFVYEEKKNSEKHIEKYTLKNGINVYIHNNPAVHNNAVSLVVKGGISHLERNTSGLENALFSVMSSSSKKYSKAERDKITSETGASISETSKISGSALSLTSLDKYFYDSLDMLTDGFLNPAFEKDVLDVLYKSLESSVHEISNEPQSCLSYNINEFLYKNHPYDVKVFVVPDSLENITKENMEALHERIISPENIIVAASGNIDSKKLIKKLNKTLGKLSKKTEQKLSESETSAAEISPVVISDFSDVMIENSSTKGTGFAMRVFSTPSQTDKDFLAFSIAMDMYSDVLFNVVREHYGACYSVSASFIGSKSSYGGEYVYQISDLKNFRKYADEALSYMKNGMLVDFFDEKGNAKLIPVKDRLLSYKNKYIASSYESAQSSHSEAFRLWYNILQFNDIERDEKLFSELYLLTSDDVVSAFNRYMNPDRGKWFVVYGEK